MIEVRGVSLSYGGHERELEEVGFSVAKGEFVSLVGPSGCGKSSLLRIIAGVLAPLAGEVLLDGRPVRERSVKVGFVPQDGLLLAWRTVLANVTLPLEIAGIPPEEREGRARRLLALVGMENAAARYPAGLSGGERQRVAIARALADAPEILLLDEPFASLDAITREELNLVLQDVWLRTGATVLLVTHSISEAVFLADRVLVMGERPGRLLGELRVDLARPRTLRDLGRAEFAALTARVRAILSEGGERLAVQAS
ncbi:MAG: ABC transporter ATP-binding protein [Firmicutes bacterium]|nr:ABC transporter ATP-binding protein [Bacillota bacterium]